LITSPVVIAAAAAASNEKSTNRRRTKSSGHHLTMTDATFFPANNTKVINNLFLAASAESSHLT